MSYPERIGTVGKIENNANNANQNIVVPSNAEIIIVTVSGYQNTANYYSAGSLTLNGVPLNVGRAQDITGMVMGVIFYLVNPTTGTQNLAWNWVGVGAPVAGTTFHYAFYKGIDISNPIRSSGGEQVVVYERVANTGELTVLGGDLIVCLCWATNEAVITSWVNATEIRQDSFNNSPSSYAEATSSTDTIITGKWVGGDEDGGVAGIVLRGAIATAVRVQETTCPIPLNYGARLRVLHRTSALTPKVVG